MVISLRNTLCNMSYIILYLKIKIFVINEMIIYSSNLSLQVISLTSDAQLIKMLFHLI